MHVDLRYAGLDPVTEQRLRLATNALAAHRMQARASEWDGTRCDIVAADPADAYGSRVLEIARRRGTPALELGTGAAEPASTVARITRALHDLLQRRRTDGAMAASHATAAATPGATGGIVRLALDASLAGIDLEATSQGAVVWLLPTSGRVVSSSVSDQLRARERLALPGWTFAPIAERSRSRPPGEVSASLDTFLLHAAWHAREQLPAFPERAVSLAMWPDLGSAPSLVEPLVVLQHLQRGHLSPEALAQRSGVARQDIDACLWALKAAGLLDEPRSQTSAPVEAPRTSGLLARLAAHFGLRRP